MENPDELEKKIKSVFSGYKQEPPVEVWENLRRELHPEPKPMDFRMRLTGSTFFPDRLGWRYVALGGVFIFVFLAVVYFTAKDQHTITGHAYAGEARLSRGVAVLFRVDDRLKPWDSVSHYRSALIDDKGYYKFSGVDPGTYLLRIAPEESSELSKHYLPSWFDQHENPDSSHTIVISADDFRADVHLLSRNSDFR